MTWWMWILAAAFIWMMIADIARVVARELKLQPTARMVWRPISFLVGPFWVMRKAAGMWSKEMDATALLRQEVSELKQRVRALEEAPTKRRRRGKPESAPTEGENNV